MNSVRWLARLMGERLPLVDGVRTVSGVSRPVAIHRDGWHVPHVEAETDADAWYGLGFCQGQDRAFQIELLRRVAQGTLSELIGADGLGIDRLTRCIGFGHAARQEVHRLDPGVREVLAAFARGISDGATVGSPRPAHEFALLRCEPTPHRAEDVLAVGKLHAFLLAGNWEAELVRLKVLLDDGPEAVAALTSVYAEHLPVTAPAGGVAGAAVDRLTEDLARLSGQLGSASSNNWALAPEMTASGRVLVANDPHLPPSLPAFWYLAHVTGPDWSMAGATFVGLPMFGAGHNGHGAWGATSAHTDNTDLYLEEIGADGRSVREGDRFVPCAVRHEAIDVKGAEPQSLEVIETPRGPVVSPALAGALGAISIGGVWRDAPVGPELLGLPRARDFEAFRTAVAGGIRGMQLNFVWGDTSGTIGWQLTGDLPVRRSGNGTVPLPGWDPAVGWTSERIAGTDLPHTRDPATGFVATANNKPLPDAAEGPFLGADWPDGYRVAAVAEALAERDDWDVRATLDLQLDTRSLPWRELREVVLAVPDGDPNTHVALALLGAWDGRVRSESPAAAVFELALAELSRRVVTARAPRAAEWALGRGLTPISPHSILVLRRLSHLVALVRDQPDGWFADPWPVVVAESLGAAVRSLRREHGDAVADWAWGRVRTVTLRHLASEAAGPLARLFDRGPYPLGGDAHTIPQASVPPLDPTGNPVAIASARMVVDVGNWEASRWVLPGGQSGNPLSPHYDDQVPLWLAGDGVPIPWGAGEVRRATRSTLRLLPTWR